jgi:hypothetical protein
MTATTDIPAAVGAPTRSPAAGWPPLGRIAAAGCFVAGGALWTVGELIGFGKDGVDQLIYLRDHPTPAGIGLTADLLGTVFMVGTAVAWFLLSRRRSSRLAVVGGVLLTLGLVMQGVMSGVEMTEFALVRSGALPLHTLDTALGSSSAMGLAGDVAMPLFLAGAFAGIVVAMVALWRSRAVARAAIVLVLLFQVGQLVGVVPTSPLLLAGLCWMAVDVLRAGAARERRSVAAGS